MVAVSVVLRVWATRVQFSPTNLTKGKTNAFDFFTIFTSLLIHPYLLVRLTQKSVLFYHPQTWKIKIYFMKYYHFFFEIKNK